MTRFVFHPAAAAEYRAAADFYEQRMPGLGARFTLEVEAAIDRIVDAPTRWPILEEDVRRCLTHAFPYGILYTIESHSILIVAVMHCSREPAYWKYRTN